MQFDSDVGDITVQCQGKANADGKPVKVVFQRWSNANPDKTFRTQPFGGCLSAFREFGGFRLPTQIEAGNFFETDDYFAFFKATVSGVRFPSARADLDDNHRD